MWDERNELWWKTGILRMRNCNTDREFGDSKENMKNNGESWGRKKRIIANNEHLRERAEKKSYGRKNSR